MYTMYSAQRPGRPRLALLAGAVLLALATALAGLLVHVKRAAAETPLNKATLYGGLGLRARLPAGWHVLPVEEAAGPVYMEAVEPAGRSGQRRLVVFRERHRSMGSVARARAATLAAVVQAISPTLQLAVPERIGAGSLGPLPGMTYALALLDPAGSGHLAGLVRVGVGPRGQVLGVLLLADRPLKSRDEDLLNEISASIVLDDLKPAGDLVHLMTEAGIQFDSPTDASFFEPQPEVVGSDERPALELAGRDGSWLLDVHRVDVSARASLEQSVLKWVSGRLTDPDLSIQTAVTELNGHEAVRMVLLSASGQACGLVWSTRAGPRSAWVAVGWCEAAGLARLDAVCRSIIEAAGRANGKK